MMAQGVYFLMHLALICNPQTNQCTLIQTILDTYRNPQVCVLMASELKELIPEEKFYCTQISNI